MKYRQQLMALLGGCTLVLWSGCGVGSDNFTNQYSLKVSALHYIKDANVSIGNRYGVYRSRGIYDFNESLAGGRVATGGLYIVDENNESNTSAVSTLCQHYLPSLDTTVTTLKLSAPAAHVPYEYININPFTTLLVQGGFSKEALALKYPVAASIEEHFDFDTTAALKAPEYRQADNNLTQEICDALQALQDI